MTLPVRRPRRLPRLRSLLLLFMLAVLLSPLAGLWLLRVYESALIRQTESELVAQAAVLAAAYKAERRHALSAGEPAEPDLPAHRLADGAEYPSHRLVWAAGLDLARDPVLDPAPNPDPPAAPPSGLARSAGLA